ncbi:MAG TPA: cytochrome C oxidase subunit IV family protein [Ignavibacteria bacterium]|nr:cytochrome C oxidase subunit IV family protein [Ignavibacteria bacterium]
MSENTHTQQHPGYGLYILVWAGLVGLTTITVALAGFNLAGLTVVTALAIAIVKSLLVTNYFMHVRTDSPVFRVFIFVCIAIFIVVIVLTFFDLTYRFPLK